MHLRAIFMCLALLVSLVEGKTEANPPFMTSESPENEAVICRMPDDSLRIFFVHRPEGNEIRSIESKDGGRTWSQPKTEFPLPGPAYYGIQVTVDKEGELQAMFHVLANGEGGWKGRRYDIWHAKTTGGRTLWTKPKRVLEGYVGSLRGFTTLKNGRLLFACAVAVESRATPAPGQPDPGWNDTITLYSDDQGETWQRGKTTLQVEQDNSRGLTRYGAIEPAVQELPDGRVWMLIRTKNGFIYETWSEDGGESWPQPVKSRFISSDSPAAILRLKDGRLVLVLNACQRWDDLTSYAIGGRELLHIALSDDEGKTWRGFREIHSDFLPVTKGDRGTAYPSAAENDSGQIVVTSGQGEGRHAILIINPDWITATSASDNFESMTANWRACGKDRAEMVEEKGRGKILSVGNFGTDDLSGVVWNFPAGREGSIDFDFKPAASSKGARIALTDHFNPIDDSKAAENAVFSFDLGPHEAAVTANRWHRIRVTWTRDSAEIFVDGKRVREIKAQRLPEFGLNYLRILGLERQNQSPGFFLDNVEANISR